jgi:hypothetical protein
LSVKDEIEHEGDEDNNDKSKRLNGSCEAKTSEVDKRIV